MGMSNKTIAIIFVLFSTAFLSFFSAFFIVAKFTRIPGFVILQALCITGRECGTRVFTV